MHGFVTQLDVLFGRIVFILAVLVAASIGLMAVLIPCNLLLLKMQWGNLGWLYEASEYALYTGVFIGAPWVLRQGAHVRVDVLTTALPAVWSKRLDQAVNVAGALLCLFLCYYGVRAGLSEFADGTLPDKDLRIANWIMVAVFAVSFLLLAIEFLLRLHRTGDAGRIAGAAQSGF